ncbi:uncharacterized protein [Spinacia oleracea]|uniref:Endonuclease/exonuclease/phosphatase domain-containing protein n=1 Tax=Spinacia oleracea TaxID=3562 RepID=A0A9R0HYG9_SPIOL|nr:uncharacterized protein LOC110777916 [Spinacia oleracea]
MNITKAGSEPWYFTAVYASPDPSRRRELWKELKDFANTHKKPWLIAGDFNNTRFPSERNTSCAETSRHSAKFNNWVEDMELLEIEFTGASHTWARGLNPESRRSGRLDRSLCNTEWGLRFERAKAVWLTHENFQEFVRTKWKQSDPLVPTLKHLSEELQIWSKEVYHNIFRRKRSLTARIEGIQKTLTSGYHRGLIKLELKLR